MRARQPVVRSRSERPDQELSERKGIGPLACCGKMRASLGMLAMAKCCT